eukprot:scaffold3673_cov105-Pinguiococcus_pyrenoidosus.AAC.1
MRDGKKNRRGRESVGFCSLHPSVRLSDYPSVLLSVCPSVRPAVRPSAPQVSGFGKQQQEMKRPDDAYERKFQQNLHASIMHINIETY